MFISRERLELLTKVFATLKFNSNGEKQWVAQYNGSDDYYDIACAITIDSIGNAYVTGTSRGKTDPNLDIDYATVKYNASGRQEWFAQSPGVGNSSDRVVAMAVDELGNSFVTGSGQFFGEMASSDFITIKYDHTGNQLWLAIFDRGKNQIDEPIDLAIDKNGFIYVTGKSFNTEYMTNYDYATIKYDTNGKEKWIAFYDNNGNYDEAVAVKVDDLGNVYVTGKTKNKGNSYECDIVTVKYNSDGIEQFSVQYKGPSNKDDIPNDMELDALGNVYVTGYSISDSSGKDFITIKYNSLGQEVWCDRHDLDHRDDEAIALAVDPSGDIYITGQSGFWYTSIIILKYNKNGELIWTINTDNTPVCDDLNSPNDIVIDKQGNFFIIGYSGSGYAPEVSYGIILKYNSNGNLLWSDYDYNSDYYENIIFDDMGNIYIGTGGHWDIDPEWNGHNGFSGGNIALKYDSTGQKLWRAYFDGPGNCYWLAKTIGLDKDGNLYTAGTCCGNTWSVFATAKFKNSVTGLSQVIKISNSYLLLQNFPNPFNSSTTISFSVSGKTRIKLSIYDILGREIENLLDDFRLPGEYKITREPKTLSSGVYFCKIETDEYKETIKLLLLK